MHYLRNMVLAAFRAAHPDEVEPTPNMIDDYDQTLFELFEDELAVQAAENGVDFNDFNRSMLVYFADRSTSPGIDGQVEDAFVYFLKVVPIP